MAVAASVGNITPEANSQRRTDADYPVPDTVDCDPTWTRWTPFVPSSTLYLPSFSSHPFRTCLSLCLSTSSAVPSSGTTPSLTSRRTDSSSMATTSPFTSTYNTRDTPAPSVLLTVYRTRRSSLVAPSSSSGPPVYSEHSQTLSVTSPTTYTSSPSGGRPSVSSAIPLSVILLSEQLTLSFAMPTATHTTSTTASSATTGAPLQALQRSDLGRALGAGLGIGLTAFILLVVFAVIFLVRRRRSQPPSFKFEHIGQPNEHSDSPPPPSPMHAALLEAAVAAQHARDVSGQDMFVSAPHANTVPSRTRHTRNGSLASLPTPTRQTVPFARSRPSATTAPQYTSDPFAADSGSIYAQDNVYSLEDIRTVAVTPPPIAHLPARKSRPGPARKVAFS